MESIREWSDLILELKKGSITNHHTVTKFIEDYYLDLIAQLCERSLTDNTSRSETIQAFNELSVNATLGGKVAARARAAATTFGDDFKTSIMLRIYEMINGIVANNPKSDLIRDRCDYAFFTQSTTSDLINACGSEWSDLFFYELTDGTDDIEIDLDFSDDEISVDFDMDCDNIDGNNIVSNGDTGNAYIAVSNDCDLDVDVDYDITKNDEASNNVEVEIAGDWTIVMGHSLSIYNGNCDKCGLMGLKETNSCCIGHNCSNVLCQSCANSSGERYMCERCNKDTIAFEAGFWDKIIETKKAIPLGYVCFKILDVENKIANMYFRDDNGLPIAVKQDKDSRNSDKYVFVRCQFNSVGVRAAYSSFIHGFMENNLKMLLDRKADEANAFSTPVRKYSQRLAKEVGADFLRKMIKYVDGGFSATIEY